jgi:hypothetical protein
VTGGKVQKTNLFSVQKKIHLPIEGYCRPCLGEHFLPACHHARANVAMRDNRRERLERGISAGVVAMDMGIDHEPDRLLRETFESSQNLV